MTGQMRTSRRILMTAAAAASVAIATLLLTDRDAASHLAGAEQLADGAGDVGLWATAAGEDGGVSLDDLPVRTTTIAMPGNDGDILLLVEDATEAGLVQASTAGDVERVGPVVINDKTTAFGINAAGTYGVASGAEMLLSSDEWLLPGAGTRMQAPFEIGALAIDDDGTVLAGSATDARIDVLSADDEPRRLLGPADDPEAQVTAAKPLGPIVALTWLDDDRIAFVADTPDGYRLHLLDDATVTSVPTPDSANPVRSSDTSPTDEPGRRERPSVTPLAPGPNGGVLTVGLNDDDVPEINLVDVDTGETELLATLDGVEPTLDEPVSAALAGDDLVFTAEGRIWRLADAR